MIKPSEIVECANWCSEFDAPARDDDGRAATLHLGAFRAFEWLKQNGWKVVKDDTAR